MTPTCSPALNALTFTQSVAAPHSWSPDNLLPPLDKRFRGISWPTSGTRGWSPASTPDWPAWKLGVLGLFADWPLSLQSSLGLGARQEEFYFSCALFRFVLFWFWLFAVVFVSVFLFCEGQVMQVNKVVVCLPIHKNSPMTSSGSYVSQCGKKDNH